VAADAVSASDVEDNDGDWYVDVVTSSSERRCRRSNSVESLSADFTCLRITRQSSASRTYRIQRLSRFVINVKYIPSIFVWYLCVLSVITGPPTHSVGGQTSKGSWRLSSSVVVCNTPRRACRRLHPRRPGDDVMPPLV